MDKKNIAKRSKIKFFVRVYNYKSSCTHKVAFYKTVVNKDVFRDPALKYKGQCKAKIKFKESTGSRLFLVCVCCHRVGANPSVKISFSEMSRIVESRLRTSGNRRRWGLYGFSAPRPDAAERSRAGSSRDPSDAHPTNSHQPPS
ncbi:60S ribosomal protein L27 [Tupaia chinensis]|uniref:60S ribosomal protein L27 n=1 Tax=Tupaia chinensis TaxID=246437 RepID=L9KSD8_TUPCH|nr:60S ribosomal protein L27 [Tupaia chinensis]